MKKWIIPVTWEVCGVVEVEVNTLDEALRYVEEDPDDIPLPSEHNYVDGSFRPSMDDIEEIRSLYNNNQADLGMIPDLSLISPICSCEETEDNEPFNV